MSVGYERPGPSIFEERVRQRREQPFAAPLGALTGAGLDDRQMAALRTIADYDLAPIRQRLLLTGSASGAWVDEAIFEFRRYLGLRVVFRDPITMISSNVDEVWHACILFTRLYADLCERAFGTFLHHDPDMDSGLDRQEKWNKFESAYRSVYGDVGPLWELSRPLERNGTPSD